MKTDVMVVVAGNESAIHAALGPSWDICLYSPEHVHLRHHYEYMCQPKNESCQGTRGLSGKQRTNCFLCKLLSVEMQLLPHIVLPASPRQQLGATKYQNSGWHLRLLCAANFSGGLRRGTNTDASARQQ
jgi:hypothetical protein